MSVLDSLMTTGQVAALLKCTRQAIQQAERLGRIKPPEHRLDGVGKPNIRLYTPDEVAAIAAVVKGGKRRCSGHDRHANAA